MSICLSARMEKKDKPVIVFACAGCSLAGQAAYRIALELDKLSTTEMSCLAGVAAQKTSFDRKIKGKRILTIDGCPTECSKGVFDNRGIEVDLHVKLKDYAIRKTGPIEEDTIRMIRDDVERQLTLMAAGPQFEAVQQNFRGETK